MRRISIFLGLNLLSLSVLANPVDCAEKALQAHWTMKQAALICARGGSDASIQCAEAAFKKQWTPDQAARLCSGAKSNAPIDCGEQSELWDIKQVVILCSGASSPAPNDCATDALKRGWNPEEAATMCQE